MIFQRMKPLALWVSLATPFSMIGTAVSIPLLMSSVAVHAGSTVDFSDLVEKVSPAVVRVNVFKKMSREDELQQQLPELLKRFFGNNIQIPNQPQTPVEQKSYGSAFFITQDGYLLTNNHVIADARRVTITLNDRRELDAEVVGKDERTDIAVLKVKGTSFPALRTGDSNALRVGEPVLAIGSPFGFDYSASAGIVSAKSRSMNNESNVPFIQTDVALNPGNSGGPLFNQKGEVIGINSRIFSGTGGYMGLSFSIPIDVALDVSDQLRNGGKVKRAYLGVFPQDIDRNLAEVYGLAKPEGALVAQVSPDSAASIAGIKAGDIILTYNNVAITRSADLINQINRSKPETIVPIVLQRDGKKMNVFASLKAVKEDGTTENTLTEATAGPTLGLQLRELTVEEQSALKTKGVAIKSLTANASAVRSGLLVGDVITRINGQEITSLADFTKASKRLPINKVVGVSLIRQGSPIIVGLRIESEDKK